METNLPNSDRFRELVIEKAFKPILDLIIENKCHPDYQKIKQGLFLFDFINCENLCKNNVYTCFEALKEMYAESLIPLNVFWISCVNVNIDDYFINPHNFFDQLNNIKETIVINGFELTHDWIFGYKEYTGIFLYFKPTEISNYFVSIFIAYKNIDGNPTLLEIINEKK